MMATDDATLNAGDKKKTQPIKGTQEKKLKGNLKFVTGQKERFMKNWLALEGFFFFVFFKKEDLLLLFNLPPSAGVFERFISKWDIWMVRKSEGGGETKSI